MDAFPICIETQDAEEIIRIAKNIAPVFGGINRKISRLRTVSKLNGGCRKRSISPCSTMTNTEPQWCSAALINALKLAKKTIGDMTIVLSGAGSAGTAIVKC